MLRSPRVPRHALRRATLALLAATLPAATAVAQGGSLPATIEACYVPVSGTVYRINTAASPAPGAPAKCLSSAHVPFKWNVAGPPGPGLSDFSEVTSEGTPAADASGRRSMSAGCPTGKMAVGGNYSIFANGGNYAWGIVPVSSGVFSSTFNPADPPNTFFVLTVDAPGYASVPFFRVSVKCAKAP